MKGNKYIPFMLRRGDGSTLSLDFTAMGDTLDSRFTFTRSSTATYINSSGLVATAGTNVPRFDYDPTTLTPRGLLIEGTATNLVTNSQNITTSTWTIGGNTTLTANTTEVTDPAGGNTATKIALGANAYCSRAQAVTVLANTAYTFSFWIRGTTGSQRRIFESGGTDLVSQTTLTYTNTGWTRVQIQFTSATNTTLFVYVCSKNTSAGSSDVLYVWGAQLEAGGASSYILTGASSVQRAADSCQMTGTIFSSWFNATEGTFFARGRRRLTSTTAYLLSANDTTNAEALSLGSSTTGNWLIRDGNSDVASITPGTVTANTTYKIAGAFAVNDSQAALNGTLGTADTSLTLPTVSQLDLGRDRSTVYLNGTIESIKFWPTRLPNATLQSLTA